MAFFQPLWMTYETKKADRAAASVRKIKDPQKLLEIALHAPLEEVSQAAIGNITDPGLLAKIVLNGDWSKARTAAEKITDPQLLQDLLCAGCEAVPLDRITDPDALVRIALNSRSSDIRCRAIDRIRDAEVLLRFMRGAPAADERKTAEQILKREFLSSSFRPGKTLLTPEQFEKYLEALIAEKNENIRSYIPNEADESDLLLIYRRAGRVRLRADALCALGRSSKNTGLSRLYLQACRLEEQRYGWNYWREARKSLMAEAVRRGAAEPRILMDFIKNAETGGYAAIACMTALFGHDADGAEGIEALREEAVELYLKNVPAYRKEDGSYGEDFCICKLAELLPPEAREKYGFRISGTESEAEDEFGRYRKTTTLVEFRGKRYRL